ncbi:hypothetical protein WCD74_29515 [Actinomycetospora sp. OC33-EN08]|uniref:Uncharacterized protein n=1 Tax=Actinomycetospora aurantiaca TaxID=3129233 RepID=A0ABU8MXC9_9PSEU
MTEFFVPGADDAEARYAELAEFAGAEPAPPADRLRSLRFARGAEEWTATVGEHLSGLLAARTGRRPARRSSATRSAPSRRVDDPTSVLAIFFAAGTWLAVTDARPVGAVDDSVWDNPVRIPDRDVREMHRFG